MIFSLKAACWAIGERPLRNLVERCMQKAGGELSVRDGSSVLVRVERLDEVLNILKAEILAARGEESSARWAFLRFGRQADRLICDRSEGPLNFPAGWHALNSDFR
jgi:hypothetical protein